MDKSPDAFRTISEVADLLETPAHVLRFWESRFPQIKPVKRAGGRRYYRPADMALLTGIRKLLHEEGMTIRGVQKILREQGVRHVSGLTDDYALDEHDDLPEEDDAIVEAPPVSSDPIPLFPKRKEAEEQTEPDSPLLALESSQPVKRQQDVPDVPEPQSDLPSADAANQNAIEAAGGSTPATENVDSTLDDALVAKQDKDREPPSAQIDPVPQEAPRHEPIAATVQPTVQKPLPGPLPPPLEIAAEYLAADLRKLTHGAFGTNQAKAQALYDRLQALRTRVGDLGRAPRR